MPPMSHSVVDQLLVTIVFRCFFVFGIIGFAVGVGLIVNHAGMHRLFGVMNRWVSMRRGLKWLEVPRDTEPAKQHLRRLTGVIFILLAAFSAYALIKQVDVDALVAAMRVKPPFIAHAAWLMGCIRWFLVAGSILAVAVGFMLVFSPTTLQAIEMRANHWYSSRRLGRGSDVMHMGFDNWVELHPRAMGWLITIAALVVVIEHGMLLARG